MHSWRGTFRAVWLANLVTSAGMMSFLPFFASHLTELGLEDRDEIATWAGLLFGAAPLSAAIMSPIWGSLGDRYGRKLMVLRSMLAIALFVGAMSFATSPWQLLVLRLLQGAFSGFVAPSLTLVSVAAPANAQARSSASLQQSMTLGAIVGPVLGELLRAWLGARWAYLGVSVAALFSAGIVWLWAHEDARHRLDRGGERFAWRAVLRQSFGDLDELRTNKAVRLAALLTFWMQFGAAASTPLLEIFVGDLGAPSVGGLELSAGWLFTAVGLANLIALPWWGRIGDDKGPRRALIACALLGGVTLGLHALATSYAALFVLRLLFGAATAGSGSLAFGVAAVETAVERRGSAFGVVFAARCFAVAIAAAIGGALSGWLGIRGLFLLGGASVLLAVAHAHLSTRRTSRSLAS